MALHHRAQSALPITWKWKTDLCIRKKKLLLRTLSVANDRNQTPPSLGQKDNL